MAHNSMEISQRQEFQQSHQAVSEIPVINPEFSLRQSFFIICLLLPRDFYVFPALPIPIVFHEIFVVDSASKIDDAEAWGLPRALFGGYGEWAGLPKNIANIHRALHEVCEVQSENE